MRLLATALILWVQGYLFSPELIKLPALWLHFVEHRAEQPDLDLGSFLAMHYEDAAHQEGDHDGHESLPFHHHHGAALDQCGTKLIAGEPVPAVSFPQLSGALVHADIAADDPMAGFRTALLQPPRARA